MKKNNAKWHILGWTVFISYELIMILLSKQSEYIWKIFVCHITDVLVFYCSYQLFRKFAAEFKKTWKSLIPLLGVQLVLFVVLIVVLHHGMATWITGETIEDYTRLSALAAYRVIYFFVLSFTCWQFRRIYEVKVRAIADELIREQLEGEKLKMENAWLRAQIRPHMMFNLLSMIQQETKRNSEVSRLVHVTADMLEFALQEPDEDGLVCIKKEWEQVKRFMALQQIRFEPQELQVQSSALIEDGNNRVPALCVFTLVENVYQYGILDNKMHPAQIHLQSGAWGWRLDIFNLKKEKPCQLKESHVGVINTRTRLQQAYGADRYSLEIDNQAKSYRLSLIVKNL